MHCICTVDRCRVNGGCCLCLHCVQIVFVFLLCIWIVFSVYLQSDQLPHGERASSLDSRSWPWHWTTTRPQLISAKYTFFSSAQKALIRWLKYMELEVGRTILLHWFLHTCELRTEKRIPTEDRQWLATGASRLPDLAFDKYNTKQTNANTSKNTNTDTKNTDPNTKYTI